MSSISILALFCCLQNGNIFQLLRSNKQDKILRLAVETTFQLFQVEDMSILTK